jgi:hypothetical protein
MFLKFIFVVVVFKMGSSEKTLTNISVTRKDVHSINHLSANISKVDYSGAEQVCTGMGLKLLTLECEAELKNLINYTLADTGKF